ncbi:chemotaxis protein CheB [Deminuibacter soli]|uniref:PAS domain S-box protein n=1 Tax=Deminuibacter soli TaxID=2291815 RepID=A0A3E1NQ73_9BACT|nr:chemotaxis protein CheB [Deminuibacter soli]RFM29964.1 PAS domain S-box protein [Deminuibacter soli]
MSGNKTKRTEAPEGVNDQGHYVVAIGASAGGLEAIHEFFDNMPETANLSFVIIQHLSPDYKSLLVELVSRHTHMKVYEAKHELLIQKNCIYVIPNNKVMTIGRNKLLLADKRNEKAPNTAIDSFLYTLAKEKKEKAIAIILSGTGTDGTKGIEAIKAAGGMVMVQTPESARFDGMPNSAIASGNADVVLTPAAMPAEMFSHITETPVYVLDNGKVNDDVLQEIFGLIHKASGYDFHYYKTPTILRRISRRMMQHNVFTLEEYLQLLRGNQEEAALLGKDFLIGVTRFFRDAEAFELLKTRVIPAIVAEKSTGDTIKIWVAACSTGEEAYSIAICFDQLLAAQDKKVDVKIFATDLDESNIEIASKGAYPFSIAQDVDPLLLENYFIREQDSYTIIPRIRKQIVFAKHNIIKDPPFIKNELVSCRNMLIYLGTVLQQKIYAVLLFAMQPNGYLLLGSSENPNYIKDALIEINSKWKLYRKISGSSHSPALFQHPIEGMPEPALKPAAAILKTESKTRQGSLADAFREALAEEFNYAAFYIDQQYEIKEASGNFDHFLSLPKKSLQLNLLRMLPQDLSVNLSITIKHAWKDGQKKTLRNLRYTEQQVAKAVNLMVKPPSKVQGNGYTLVVIGDASMEYAAAAQTPSPASAGTADTSAYMAELEAELSETKYSLQMAVEGLETTNEELQSSNEELLSANEELQSSNEELQSLNEELHTLNTEYQLKIKELIELNDDLNNYFRSTDIGQVFLDMDLRIRKFNPASVRIINFIETDIGRPISHISTNLRYENLIGDIETVLKDGDMIEREVQLQNGVNLLVRIMPYLRQNKQHGGVILSFVDVTTITDLNNIIRGIFNSSRSAIIAFKAVRNSNLKVTDFLFQTANAAAAVFFADPAETYTGKSLQRIAPVLAQQGLFDKYVQLVQNDKPLQEDVQLQEMGGRWFAISAVKMMDGFVATYTDISEKKSAEQKLRKNYNELITVKENLRQLNIELENKVLERTRELTQSDERFRLVSRATNDAIWDWDFVNNKVWWNDSFFAIFGYASGEYNRAFWLNKVHPEERERTGNSIYAIINSNETQWSAEYRFLKADGTYANILDRAYVLHDEFNTPYRMLGSMLDVTELKRAEKAVARNIAERRFLAESVPLILYTANAAKQVDFANKHFELYTGISAEAALGNGWQQVVYETDLPVALQAWDTAARNGNGFQLELRLRTAGNNYHWNLMRAKPHRDNEGQTISWIITSTDIHEQKSINELLEQKVKQRTAELQKINVALENSNSDLQQFASVASHDLQEPLRKIHMFSKMLKDKYAPTLEAPAADYLARIIHSSARMRSLITDILNFSRLSASNYRFEWVSLNGIVHEILEDLEITIQEKKAKIIIAHDLPELEVIPGQMRQVFQNLISNSLKFVKKELEPVITIDAELVNELNFNSMPDKNGAFCKITVKDNGIGFDEHFKNTIFTLFQRLHSKDKYEGSGIGLAITKKIIDKHNGIISAHSEEGKGAVFTILLPVAQRHVATVG